MLSFYARRGVARVANGRGSLGTLARQAKGSSLIANKPLSNVRFFSAETEENKWIRPGTALRKFTDQYSKHESVVTLRKGKFRPKIGSSDFIAPCATIVGNVELYEQASVWYGCVIRADVKLIRIGYGTNVQDNTVITEALGPLHGNHDGSTIVGHFVTIGHNCFLKACTVEDQCFVGMSSVLEPDSYMEKQSMLGANSVLAGGSRIPSGELWLGNPAKFFRKLTGDEIAGLKASALHYQRLAREHKACDLGDLTNVREALQLGYIQE